MRHAVWPGLALILAIAVPAAAADVSFSTKPAVARDADKLKISFAVSEPTDVEVAVLSSTGQVVRHLAAGVLGKNAPEPFKKDTLAQELTWDGRDDLGKPAAQGPFKVRVSIGAQPRLEKYLGWDGNTLGLNVVALTVGKAGELYVLESDNGWGLCTLHVFSKEGKYLRTILPYPANTPAERVAPLGQLEIEGQRIPTVFSGHGGNLAPLTAGMKQQRMVFHPRGYLLLASAVGNIAEHGPPRHLLALHPQGGAPEGVGFVGPRIRKALGFMGGSGERDCRFFDHLALSPDGEWIYYVPCKLADKKPGHVLYRLKWSDKELGAPFLGKEGQAGPSDDQFNDPQGVATDDKGNLYVCDRGNNRVLIFSASGKLLGKFAADKPEQIAVHPASGEIYLLCRGRDEKRPDRWSEQSVLLKFSAWSKGEPREAARISGPPRNIELMALDCEASPPRLWVVIGTGWQKPQQLVPVTDKGGALEAGAPINNSTGLRYPWFMAADPARNRVLVREIGAIKPLAVLDTATGLSATMDLKGTDLSTDRDGNLYVMDGYGQNSLSRYTPDGKPLPFAATGSNRIKMTYRAYAPNIGLRGHCVAPNGDIYVLRSNNYGLEDGTGCCLDVFGQDGSLKKGGLIQGLGSGDCGLAVDAAGNIYIGANVKPKDKPFPEPFMGKVPAEGWVWWRKPREGLWDYPYYNPYLYHWGAVLKFGPAGGAFYGHVPNGAKDSASPLISAANAPPDAVDYRSGYLAREIKVKGALWRYAGCGVIPTSDVNWGDSSCVCMVSHLAADEYGRVYAPNPFWFSVEMLDTAGNRIARIGRYGNADSAGPGSQVPEPEIAFAWPSFVSSAGGKMFVGDCVNRRITVVRFDHAAEETCEAR